LTAKLTQKQQEQEPEDPVLQSVETHDLQEILVGIDSYLQRLGDIDPDWEQSCSIRKGVKAVLQERRHQARQTTLLSYFKKKSEEPPTDPKKVDDPVNPEDPQPGHSSRQ
jgi:hypothetical protein